LEALLWDQDQEVYDLAARADSAQGQVREFYLKRMQQVRDNMTRERAQLAALPADTAASWMENKQVPLGAEIPDDEDIAKLITTYKKEVAKLPPPLTAAAGGGLNTGYAGVDACVSCHAAEVAFWKRTKHARAVASLAKDNHQKDVSCIPCHVTAGLIGLPDVQCESCHGPAAKHVAQPNMPGLVMRTSTEAQCRTCHTKERSTEFEFKTFMTAVIGKGHQAKAKPIAR
jgi:Cytochrome c554 and c-prime